MNKTITLPEDVLYLLDTLQKGGYEAYIVGGCVRDSILGRTPQDWDITTSALPEQTKALFPHTFDTGIQHGTITVVCHKTNYEITTYRIDGDYKDGRHPDSVAFTPNLEEDLLRRDFTMNAIAYHPEKGFQDPFHGQEDIATSCIRGVGEPAKRFQEDALRMLRCVRFAAQLGFSVEPATYRALQENAPLIEKISVERIHEELDKLWKSPFSEKLPLLLESELLPHIDTLFARRMEEQGTALIPLLKAAPPLSLLRWTLVLHDYTEKEAKDFCKKLKFDNTSARNIQILLRHLSKELPKTPYAVRKLAGELGIEITEHLFLLWEILGKEVSSLRNTLEKALSDGDCLHLKSLAVNGQMLMDMGIPKGKEVGRILGILLDDVLETPSHNTKEYLMELAKHQRDSDGKAILLDA